MAYTTKEQLEQVLTAMVDSGTIEPQTAYDMLDAVDIHGGQITVALRHGIANGYINSQLANAVMKSLDQLRKAAR